MARPKKLGGRGLLSSAVYLIDAGVSQFVIRDKVESKAGKEAVDKFTTVNMLAATSNVATTVAARNAPHIQLDHASLAKLKAADAIAAEELAKPVSKRKRRVKQPAKAISKQSKVKSKVKPTVKKPAKTVARTPKPGSLLDLKRKAKDMDLKVVGTGKRGVLKADYERAIRHANKTVESTIAKSPTLGRVIKKPPRIRARRMGGKLGLALALGTAVYSYFASSGRAQAKPRKRAGQYITVHRNGKTFKRRNPNYRKRGRR